MFDQASGRKFERSLEIEPDSATTQYCYGVMLAGRGVYDKAFSISRSADEMTRIFSGFG